MLKMLGMLVWTLSFFSIPAISIVQNNRLEDGTVNAKYSSFINKHGKKVILIGNVCLLFGIGFWFYISMLLSIDALNKAMADKQPISQFAIRCIVSLFLVGMIMFTGIAGAFVGCLSAFQYNITRKKRIILLIICLLPAFLTIADLIIQPQFSPSSNDYWLIIKLGLLYSSITWLSNGITIIFGKHFLTFASVAAKKILSFQKHRSISPDP
jgi:hypothetical protein